MKTAFLLLIALIIALSALLFNAGQTIGAQKVETLRLVYELSKANRINAINNQTFEDWQKDNATYEARYFKMYEKAIEKFNKKK